MEVRYPTEEELDRIAEWPYEDIGGLMEFVYNLWEFKEFGWRQDGEIYILSTGGWSGNESLIYALKENIMFWSFYWESSTRGGRHVFGKLTRENIDKFQDLYTKS